MNITNGVVGLLIKVTVKEDGSAVNISTATTKEIKLRGPSGTAKTKTADFFTNGSDGILIYTTIANDIDEVGVWDIQAHVVLNSGFDGHTLQDSFVVNPNIV